jgi:CDP-diacylglycerol--glycerol-3-phosphate 3-phosphatidyltransferase
VHAVNLPNAITVARIALVPVVVLVMLDAPRGGSPALAAALVLGAALSDALDGHLARRRESITRFGTLVDPIADKALITGALAVLVAQDRLALWIAVVIVARELAVTAMRFYANRRGVVVPASALGKHKATAQIVAVIVLILAPDPGALWVLLVVYLALALTLVSGVQYFTGLGRRLAAKEAGDGTEVEGRELSAGADQAPAAPRTGSSASRAKSSSRDAPRR